MVVAVTPGAEERTLPAGPRPPRLLPGRWKVPVPPAAWVPPAVPLPVAPAVPAGAAPELALEPADPGWPRGCGAPWAADPSSSGPPATWCALDTVDPHAAVTVAASSAATTAVRLDRC